MSTEPEYFNMTEMQEMTPEQLDEEFKNYVAALSIKVIPVSQHKEGDEYMTDDDEDERVFLLALKNVLEAQGGDMTAVAKEAQLTRQSLHKILSKKGNPRLTSLRSVLHVLGYDLAIRSFKNR
jgi:probable addiction module antidote protein